MADEEWDTFDPAIMEGLFFNVQQADLKGYAEAYLDERRQALALRAQQDTPGLTVAQLAAKLAAEEKAAGERFAPEEESTLGKAGPEPLKAGRFPAPPIFAGVRR